MSLRERYLARYTSNAGSRKLKKEKSSSRSSTATVIVTGSVFSNKVIADAKVEAEGSQIVLDADDAPVTVPAKEFKGFKRIDNGQMATQLEAKEAPLALQPHQKTVFRDSSGRIVDIDQKREQHAKSQEEKAASTARREITLPEEDQIAQAKQSKQKPVQAQVDDPLLVFKPESINRDIDLYQVYRKGMHPANRFGIKAGYFWDGIDRSNGFEELLSRKRNEAKFKVKDRAINEVYDLDDASD